MIAAQIQFDIQFHNDLVDSAVQELSNLRDNTDELLQTAVC